MAATAATVTGAFALSAPWEMRGGPRMKAGEERLRQVVINEAPRSESPVIFKAPGEEQLSMNWGYAEGVYTAAPTNVGEWKGAIRLSAEQAKEWAGSTITSISVGNPVDVNSREADYELQIYVYNNPIREASVWIAESLDGEPVVTGKGELGERGFEWSQIELDKPYTIEGDKAIYIGYTLDIPADPNDPKANANLTYYGMMTDGAYTPDPDGCYVYSTFSGIKDGFPTFGDKYGWQDMGSLAGNLSVRAMINGDNLPVNNATPYSWMIPGYVVPGEKTAFGVLLQNHSATRISTVEYTMEVEGMEPQKSEAVLSQPLGYLDISEPLYYSFNCTTVGNNISCKAYISAINGEPVDLSADAIEGVFLCIDEGFPRNVVVEEATGTWCGWCVIGYDGMEYMSKNYYGKGFIGIAVHQGDEMDVMSTGPYANFGQYVAGFPMAYFNRDMTNEISPDRYELEYWFEEKMKIPAYAEITAALEVGDNPSELKLNTKSKFADNEKDAAYAIGYTVVENGVGPYAQQNYCSGEPYDYYGFESMGKVVPLIYNDVARECSQPDGIPGSLPSEIEMNKEYEYSTSITLGKEIDPKMVRVVAMVINLNNGAIENACELEVPGYMSVNELESSAAEAFAIGGKGEILLRGAAAGAVVYSADGRVVAAGVDGESVEVPAGIYVVSLDGKAVKVAVR